MSSFKDATSQLKIKTKLIRKNRPGHLNSTSLDMRMTKKTIAAKRNPAKRRTKVLRTRHSSGAEEQRRRHKLRRCCIFPGCGGGFRAFFDDDSF